MRQAATRPAGVRAVEMPDAKWSDADYLAAMQSLPKRPKRKPAPIPSQLRISIAKLFSDGRERTVNDVCVALGIQDDQQRNQVIYDIRWFSQHKIITCVDHAVDHPKCWVRNRGAGK
jgi:hypothetical protein